VKLYIDGHKVQSAPIGMMSSCNAGTNICITMGGSKEKEETPCDWCLGPTFLVESALKSLAIYYIFLRGSTFRGTHSGSIPVSGEKLVYIYVYI
jgi:hypothetical protein